MDNQSDAAFEAPCITTRSGSRRRSRPFNTVVDVLLLLASVARPALSASQLIMAIGISLAIVVAVVQLLTLGVNGVGLRARVTTVSLSRTSREQLYVLLFSAVAVVTISPLVALVVNWATDQFDSSIAAGTFVIVGEMLALLLLGLIGARQVVNRIEAGASTWADLYRDALDLDATRGGRPVRLTELQRIRSTLARRVSTGRRPRIRRLISVRTLDAAAAKIVPGARNAPLVRGTIGRRTAIRVAFTTWRGGAYILPSTVCAISAFAAPDAVGSGFVTNAVAVGLTLLVAGLAFMIAIGALRSELIWECLGVLEELKAQKETNRLIAKLQRLPAEQRDADPEGLIARPRATGFGFLRRLWYRQSSTAPTSD